MSRVRPTEIFTMPSTWKSYPSLPESTGPFTIGSSKASQKEDRGGLEPELLKYDQRCLVTGIAPASLRAYRLVDETSRKENVSRKKGLESILTRQQFGSGHFSLDSLPNCITVEDRWYNHAEDGTFCITVPLLQIDAIVEKLEKSNRDWDVRAKSDPQASRNLNLKEYPFVVEKCVLLVLLPQLFLPEGVPIQINTHRVLRKLGGPPLTETERPVWTLFYPQDSSPYLIGPSGQEFTEFDYVSQRNQDQALSIFSLLVNSHPRLQSVYKRGGYPPGLEDYITTVEKAVRAIFFAPPGALPIKNEFYEGVPLMAA